ncbi:hypothetical protein B0H14DRAFT_2592214 [Mycena olivaceomarginata]|nr:hypothetical protein B0H14DRAFT_2617469 [Mycena olivaceomarginata]KAJ7832263.1 hypothetical protein B0H14DRAFT_2592214 [Mycena olivaceomarginata]
MFPCLWQLLTTTLVDRRVLSGHPPLPLFPAAAYQYQFVWFWLRFACSACALRAVHTCDSVLIRFNTKIRLAFYAGRQLVSFTSDPKRKEWRECQSRLRSASLRPGVAAAIFRWQNSRSDVGSEDVGARMLQLRHMD